MRSFLAIYTVLALALFCDLHAAESIPLSNPSLAPLKAADDARVAAMKSGDRDALHASFSEDLHYAHSTGEVDSKASLIGKLTSGKTKYAMLDYEKREFSLAGPEVALMTGRVHIRAVSGENTTDSILSFLGVWRLEKGEWHFLAWQSCKLPTKSN